MSKIFKFDDMLNENSKYDFQPGDRVRCIQPNSDNAKFVLDGDEIYTIFKIKENEDGKIKIGLAEKPGLLYSPSRFKSLRTEDSDVEEFDYEPWYDEDVRRSGPKITYKIVHNFTEPEITKIISKLNARSIKHEDENGNKVVLFTSTNDKRDITDLKNEYDKIKNVYSKSK